MRFGMKIISVMFFGGLIACGTGSTPSFNANEGPGRVRLGVDTSALTPGPLYGKIRYYTSRTKVLSDSPFFVSVCTPMGSVQADTPSNTTFNMNGLPVGVDEVISIYFYSDSNCRKMEGRAVRGGITIIENKKNDKHIPKYYLMLIPKAEFTAFPVPQANTGTMCRNSDECVSPLQPTAFCNNVSKTCRYDNLFPLNNRAYVAFGQGIALQSGKVIGFPGFAKDTFTDPLAQQQSLTFDANSAILAGFDGVTDLFYEQPIVSGIQGHALAGVAVLPSGSVVIAGGATKLPVQNKVVPTYLDKDDKGNPIYTQAADATADIVVVTKEGNIIPKGGLSDKFFGAAAFVLGKSVNDYKLFIANGLVQDSKTHEWTSTKVVHVCGVDAKENISCPTTTQTQVPRVGAAYTCMKTANGICTREVMLGGNLSALPFATICTVDGCRIANLVEDIGQAKPRTNNRGLFLSQAFTLGTHIYTLGGTTWFPGIQKGSIDAWPGIFEFKYQKNDSFSIETPSFTEKTEKALRGIYQVITRIDENTVLISGGLTPDYKDGKLPVSNKAVLLTLSGGKVTARVFTMKYARFAHQAALVSAGPLKGAVLIWGGLTIDKNLDLNYLRHAEIFFP